MLGFGDRRTDRRLEFCEVQDRLEQFDFSCIGGMPEDGVSGIYMWGAQLEGQTSVPSQLHCNYYAAAATRAADQLSLTSIGSLGSATDWTVNLLFSKPYYEVITSRQCEHAV